MKYDSHKKYLRIKSEIRKFRYYHPNYLCSELAFIERYGAWMQALETGCIYPNTDAQKHFVEVMQAKTFAETNYEFLWLRYKDDCKREDIEEKGRELDDEKCEIYLRVAKRFLDDMSEDELEINKQIYEEEYEKYYQEYEDVKDIRKVYKAKYPCHGKRYKGPWDKRSILNAIEKEYEELNARISASNDEHSKNIIKYEGVNAGVVVECPDNRKGKIVYAQPALAIFQIHYFDTGEFKYVRNPPYLVVCNDQDTEL